MKKLLPFFRIFVFCFLVSGFWFQVSGCGFRPLYGGVNTFAGGGTALDSVWIDTIPDAGGVYLRNALIDRFYNNGMPENPQYLLDIDLIETGRDLAIRKNDTATRAQIVMRAVYRLIDKETRQPVDSGDIRAVSSYNILASNYATLVTQSEARELALKDLADKITLRMGVVLQGGRDKG